MALAAVRTVGDRRNAEYNEIPTNDIRLQSHHKLSDCLDQRYPFPTAAQFDPTQPTVAYGTRSIDKILDVLRHLTEFGSGDEEELTKKRANLKLLLEQLSNQSQKLRGISSGAIPVQEQLLSDADVEVRALAARVLARLASERAGRLECCSEQSQSVPKLVMLFKDSEAVVQEAAASALQQISSIEEAQRVLVAESGVIAGVVDAMPLLSPVALESALLTAATICRFHPGCLAALDAGLVPVVVGALQKTATSRAALRCLISVAGHNEGKNAAIQVGAIEALPRLLGHRQLETRRMAGSALVLLSVQSEAKAKSDVCVRPLCKMLYDGDRDVAMNALLCLRSIAEFPLLRANILSTLADDPDMFERVKRDQSLHLSANRYG